MIGTDFAVEVRAIEHQTVGVIFLQGFAREKNSGLITHVLSLRYLDLQRGGITLNVWSANVTWSRWKCCTSLLR
ncbi:MAG TPA: hypothetical protein DEF45_00985 [Rhodopirellula sp.]|nr:MAG: hypothetical protein CBD74_07445 [Saprospirales bacterium TMED214]HBV61574.1 hypothetical protein [Rhodopirellula sp.]